MNPVTVTVVRGGGNDRFGDRKPTTEHTVVGCVKWPRSSSESADYSDSVSTGYMLSVPLGADILRTDQVRLPGDAALWSVDGDVLPYENPFTGRTAGALVALTKTSG